MKIMKKIAAAALASAALFAFVGCGESEDPNNMLSVSGKKCSIDYQNENTDPGKYSRAFETLGTRHYDAVCKIETTVNLAKADATADTGNTADGIMGYIFDVYKNDDGTYNFSIAGVRYNAYKEAVQAYVTSYKNVSADYLSAGNNFCDKNGIEVNGEGGVATEKDYFEGSAGIKTLVPDYPLNKGEKAALWVDLICNDGKSTGREGEDGSYTVTFYSEDPQRKTSAAGKDTIYENQNAESKKLAEVTIPVADTNFAKIKEEGAQTYLGFYANVYGGKTLTGTWELLDLEGAAEPVELD